MTYADVMTVFHTMRTTQVECSDTENFKKMHEYVESVDWDDVYQTVQRIAYPQG